MLRTTYSDGTIVEATDTASQQNLAEVLLNSRTYTVKTLAQRLEISERSAYELIRQGLIGYGCAGAKNYRVGEPAVQRFLLGLAPLAA
ncbi:helix-turn-helix domain-containing protein [Hymenobacter sp. BT559]|uniref:helix-turn-helix domain-containing protein n=1 Tax=Hymenobacter sp. BT559 TaxID=2795729 RepID=UPI0018EDCB49|nr:helix-turn-helix domain-containing protein [Hymenobacter sp. BT559]MBJ6145713.1 hypothetical protein [Hymenobacter sp. BT559]